jgi:hypothetical protein
MFLDDVVAKLADDSPYRHTGDYSHQTGYTFAHLGPLYGQRALVYNPQENTFARTDWFKAWFSGNIHTPSLFQALMHSIPLTKKYGPPVAAVYIWKAAAHAALNASSEFKSAVSILVFSSSLYRLPIVPDAFLEWLNS